MDRTELEELVGKGTVKTIDGFGRQQHSPELEDRVCKTARFAIVIAAKRAGLADIAGVLRNAWIKNERTIGDGERLRALVEESPPDKIRRLWTSLDSAVLYVYDRYPETTGPHKTIRHSFDPMVKRLGNFIRMTRHSEIVARETKTVRLPPDIHEG